MSELEVMFLRRLFSASSHFTAIVKSPHPDVSIPSISIANYVWDHVQPWQDKVAVECGVTGRSYKYGELRDMCRRFAGSLCKAGLKPGNTLAIVMPNTAEWPAVLLGAIEAGLIVTTANPAYTAEELSKQMKNCDAHAVVTLSALYPMVQQAIKLTGKQMKPLAMIAPGLESDTRIPQDTINIQEFFQNKSIDMNFEFKGDINDTVLLPYSSGTTGLPKGVMLTHRNIVSNCCQVNGSTKICISEPATGSYQDIQLAVLPFFHIYGMVIVMLAKMAHGVKIVTVPKFEPKMFYNVLEKHQITFLYVAPPLLLFLGMHSDLQEKHIRSLRYLVSGAAPLGKLDVERFLARCNSPVTVLQAYGMTETSPATIHMEKGCTKYDSVGKPLPNTEAKIVDIETGNILPSGKVGELCIRGPQVMKGYLNNPEATEEMLHVDWLHSGDLGYVDNESSIYVVDRLKELIKVKGFQVAPAELEELLRNHPDVQDAAVIGITDAKSGEVPKAFIVPKSKKVSTDDIQKYVAEKVSAYKQLKGGVHIIESIPKSPSGKILRRMLK